MSVATDFWDSSGYQHSSTNVYCYNNFAAGCCARWNELYYSTNNECINNYKIIL